MTTATARYNGATEWGKLPDFSETLKENLRAFYPDPSCETDPVWGHPADGFVESLLAEARWAQSELFWHGFDCTKPEIRAEQANLLSTLREANDKLRKVSEDFERLLTVATREAEGRAWDTLLAKQRSEMELMRFRWEWDAATPMGCADVLKELIGHIETSGGLIDNLPRVRKPAEKQHAVAVEFAIRSLRVLEQYGIKPSATVSSAYGTESDAVRILKLLGDAIRLVRGEFTWRDIILKAKNGQAFLK